MHMFVCAQKSESCSNSSQVSYVTYMQISLGKALIQLLTPPPAATSYDLNGGIVSKKNYYL